MKAQIQGEDNPDMEQFLLCTSCSMSYMFGDFETE